MASSGSDIPSFGRIYYIRQSVRRAIDLINHFTNSVPLRSHPHHHRLLLRLHRKRIIHHHDPAYAGTLMSNLLFYYLWHVSTEKIQ